MDLAKYPYRSTFTSIARVIVPSEEDRFIAKASLSNLAGILPPGIKPDENPDMLYIAFDGAVASLVNKNDDAITASTALAINNTAQYKFISTDHNRDQIVGVIIHPSFSRFGSNEPLTVLAATDLKEPFNMCYVGALWKSVAGMLTKYLHKMGDSTDSDALSTSWEIAFSDYSIGVGAKNLFDAKIIGRNDPSYASYDKMLRANGGTGKDTGGNQVYRVIDGNALILGYSIVPNPAAEVKGILPLEVAPNTAVTEASITDKSDPKPLNAEPALLDDGEYTALRYDQCIEIAEKIVKAKDVARCGRGAAVRMIVNVKGGDVFYVGVAPVDVGPVPTTHEQLAQILNRINVAAEARAILPPDFPVILAEYVKSIEAGEKALDTAIASLSAKNLAEKNITPSPASVTPITPPNMKIESLDQLTSQWSEVRKLESAAAIADFVKTIESGSKEYVQKLHTAETLAAQLKQQQTDAEKRASELTASLAEVQKQLQTVKEAAAAAEAQQKFTERMASFDEKFDLDAEDRALIAADVRELKTDESFAAYAKKQDKLLSGKAKKAPKKDTPTKDKKDDDDGDEDGEDDDNDGDGKDGKQMKAALASVTVIPGQTEVPKLNDNVAHADLDILDKMRKAFGDSMSINGKKVAEIKPAN